VVALLVSLVFALCLVLQVGATWAVSGYDDIVIAHAALTVWTMCLPNASRRQGAVRRLWILLASDFAAWTFAQVI
jgi:hypothetical protein